MNINLSFSKHCWQYPILVTLHEKARSSRPGMFCKKGVFENFANQRCFHVNFAKFLRAPFFIEHLWWVLLKSSKAKSRSSRPEMFCKKGALRNFAKFTEKYLCQSLFFAALGMQLYLNRVSDTGLFL